MSTLMLFLSGTFATLSCVAALFFLRFWRDSGDRLFGWFSGAFFLLAIERVLLDVHPLEAFYVFRLVAFLLILWAIIEKNRAGSRQSV